MAFRPLSDPPDFHNLHVLADAAVSLLNQQLQQNLKKKEVKQSSKKKNVNNSSKKKKKGPSPAAPARLQQQQRNPQGWLRELVGEPRGMSPPAFLCSKTLTASDTNRNLNRFAVPRNVVWDILFPLMNDDEQKEVLRTGERVGGGGLRVPCHDGMGSLILSFKFWHSNLMFLFNDGWQSVVERNGLRADKDVVELWCFRDASTALHFAFYIVRGEEGNIVDEGGEGNIVDKEGEGNIVVVGEEGGSHNEVKNGVLSLEGTSEVMNDDHEEDENRHVNCKKRNIIYT